MLIQDVISSSEHVSDEGPRQESLQEEVRTLLQKGAVELVSVKSRDVVPWYICWSPSWNAALLDADSGPRGLSQVSFSHFSLVQEKGGNRNLIQPPEEEDFFPTPFPHIPVGGRLARFLNQWQLITSDKWVLSVLREVWGEVYHRSHFPIFLWYKKKAGIETWSKGRVH
jgi:hypothetical protein